jgi:hypothetical protein
MVEVLAMFSVAAPPKGEDQQPRKGKAVALSVLMEPLPDESG